MKPRAMPEALVWIVALTALAADLVAVLTAWWLYRDRRCAQ